MADLSGNASPANVSIPLETQFEPKGSKSQQLREQRLDDLIKTCREQVLQQIIGPFGLTPAMFDDKTGGNVTSQHNAEQGIFAKDSEKYVRSEYGYDKAKKEKMAEAVENKTMNSQEFTDAYTGMKEPTKRLDKNGKLVMNAELDHTVSMKEAHGQGGWMKGAAGREKMSSEKDNLNYTTHKTNRKKLARAPEEYFDQDSNIDQSITTPITEKAREAINKHMPTTGERVKYHGKEILSAGAKEAGRNALRQAMGVLIFEFANGSYMEIATIIKEPEHEVSLIDRIIHAMKRVLDRVVLKMRAAFDALISGGIQGFASNLLTFIVNNVVTTSAKVVTIIRESIKGIWAAIKMVVSPPEGASGMDVARAATKLIAGVVTTALGMLFEQSVLAFISSLPVLVPFADMLAPAVTGILTGLMTALVIFGIDRLFDALADKGTEYIEAQLEKADADAALAEQMASLIDMQFAISATYEHVAQEHHQAIALCARDEQNLTDAIEIARKTSGLREDITHMLSAVCRQRDAMNFARGELLNHC